MKTNEEIKQTTNLMIKETSLDGGFGYIFKNGKSFASVIWSTGGGWEHVSMAPLNRRVIPSWDDMCELKDMFFNDDEVVVQYHPAKSEYVNNKSNCLHLWRPLELEMPTPPTIMVGIKKGQSASEIRKAIQEVL